jgi:hypothetical protein
MNCTDSTGSGAALSELVAKYNASSAYQIAQFSSLAWGVCEGAQLAVSTLVSEASAGPDGRQHLRVHSIQHAVVDADIQFRSSTDRSQGL